MEARFDRQILEAAATLLAGLALGLLYEITAALRRRSAAFVGALFCILAFIMIIFIIVRKMIFDDPVSGWPSLVCIILMTSGVQFFCTGILGQYLAKTYLEVKNRPIYIAKEEG